MAGVMVAAVGEDAKNGCEMFLIVSRGGRSA